MEGKLARFSYLPFLRWNASRMFTDKFFVFVMGLFRLFPLNVKNKSWKDLRISLHAHHFLSFSGGREIRAYRDVIARWNDKLIAFSRVTSVNAERESSVGHGYVIERFELMPFHKPNKKVFFARYIHTFSTKNRSIRCHREEELFVTSFTQCLTVKCFFLRCRRAIFIDVQRQAFWRFQRRNVRNFLSSSSSGVAATLFYE